MINHGNITWGRPQKHDLGLIWAPGAFQTARPNRTAKSRNKSCKGQIGAVWKRVLVFGGGEGPSSGYKIQKKIQKLKTPFFFVFCFWFFFTESPAPQARETYYAADAERRRRTVPQARRSPQEAARGPSEARVTSAHPQRRVTGFLLRAAGRHRARCEQSEAAGDR